MKRVPISQVIPNPTNPRIIKDDKFKKLVKSIEEFPQMLELRPIVVDSNMVVLGGNMRLKACLAAGLKEVPIIVADQLTDAQKGEFIIKDNVGFGEWDWDLLANEWDVEALMDWGLELPFDNTPAQEATDDDYEIPEVVNTTIVLGDVIEIGQVNDKLEDFPKFLYDVYTTISTALKKGGAIYVWHASSETHNFIQQFLNAGFLFKSYIVWNKNNSTFGRADYHWKHEPCIYGWLDGASHSWYGDRKQTTVWDIERPSRSDEHPTMKPIPLCSRPIENSSKVGDIVLDAFLGSGSTMVAAHQLNRKCYGMELDPKYCQVIVDRMHKLDPSLEIKINGKPYGQN
jgi:hypothetical protein